MKKTTNKKSINKDIKVPEVKAVTRFTVKQIMDGRTRYGRIVKITSKIIYHTFEILSVVLLASFIAALAILWMAQA